MNAATYQIRVCQNPECGLRYPSVDRQSFGERCPACLGQTVRVLERALEAESIAPNQQVPGPKLSVLLDNLRSAWNVGSILRSADGFGFVRAYLCGITPSPESLEVRKTALGAEGLIAWTVHKDAVRLVEELKKQGTEVWALEREPDSVSIDSVNLSARPNNVLIVGNEVTGIDPGLLEIADRVVHIPMQGGKRSFNVAIAFALAAQGLRSKS